MLPTIIATSVSGRIVVIEPVTSSDAVGWTSTGPLHDPQLCIHPAPFGKQCTMHEASSLASCLALPGCNALTCPAPGPYREGAKRRDGIRAPICQARALKSSAAWRGGLNLERKHGMCKPGGCRSYFLSDLDAASPAVQRLRSMLQPTALPATVLLLPEAASAAAKLLGLGAPLTKTPLRSAVRGPAHAYALPESAAG